MMKFVLASFVVVLLAVNVDAQDETCISEETTFAVASDMLNETEITTTWEGQTVGVHCNKNNVAVGFRTGYEINDVRSEDHDETKCENACRDFCMTKSFSALIPDYYPSGTTIQYVNLAGGTATCFQLGYDQIYVEEFCRKAYDDDADAVNYTIVDDTNYLKGCSRDRETKNYYFNMVQDESINWQFGQYGTGYGTPPGNELQSVCGTANRPDGSLDVRHRWVKRQGVDNFEWPYDSDKNQNSLTSPSSYQVRCGETYNYNSLTLHRYTCYCNLNPCDTGVQTPSTEWKSSRLNAATDRCVSPSTEMDESACSALHDTITDTFQAVSDVTKPTGCSKVGDVYFYNSLTTSNNDNLGDFDSESTLLCSSCVDAPSDAPSDGGKRLLGATGCSNGVKDNLFETSSDVVNRSPSCGELTFEL